MDAYGVSLRFMIKFGTKFQDTILKVFIAENKKEVDKMVKVALNSDLLRLGFDIETARLAGFEDKKKYPQAGLDYHMTEPRLLIFYVGEGRILIVDTFKLGGMAETAKISSLRDLFEGRFMVAHNAKFDVGHMQHWSMKISRCDCTLIMANMIHHAEVRTGAEPSGALDKCIARELKVDIPKHLQKSNWNEPELSKEQYHYAAVDSFLTYELWKIYQERLKRHGLEKVYSLNHSIQEVVVDMMERGIRMHRKKHRELIYEWEAQRDKYYEECRDVLGDINMRSSKQMTEWLREHLPKEDLEEWPLTPSGNGLQTGKDVLSQFEHLDFVRPLSKYKQYDKLCSTYGRYLYKKLNPVTKRIHGGFNIHRPHTGRLSSSDPNCQNFPRVGDFRELFIPAKGYRFLVADYSQIEMRVAGEVTRDPTMLKAFETGKDLHAVMAAAVTGKSLKEFFKQDKGKIKEDRQLAKACNFGLLFGMGAPKLVKYASANYGVPMTVGEAMAHKDTFHTIYPGYAKWKAKQVKKVEKELEVRTALGKKRVVNKDIFYSIALNHPVQGGAAEVMLVAMRKMFDSFRDKKLDAHIVNVVHDEVVVECRKDLTDTVSKVIADEMTAAYLSIYPRATTNNLVEVGCGVSWSEAKV